MQPICLLPVLAQTHQTENCIVLWLTSQDCPGTHPKLNQAPAPTHPVPALLLTKAEMVIAYEHACLEGTEPAEASVLPLGKVDIHCQCVCICASVWTHVGTSEGTETVQFLTLPLALAETTTPDSHMCEHTGKEVEAAQ